MIWLIPLLYFVGAICGIVTAGFWLRSALVKYPYNPADPIPHVARIQALTEAMQEGARFNTSAATWSAIAALLIAVAAGLDALKTFGLIKG
jgi:hypothetical protein